MVYSLLIILGKQYIIVGKTRRLGRDKPTRSDCVKCMSRIQAVGSGADGDDSHVEELEKVVGAEWRQDIDGGDRRDSMSMNQKFVSEFNRTSPTRRKSWWN